MSKWDAARDALKMFDITLDAIKLIQAYTKLGGDDAANALIAIDSVVDRLGDGFSGEIDLATIESEIKTLLTVLNANDAKARAALDAKRRDIDRDFDNGTD